MRHKISVANQPLLQRLVAFFGVFVCMSGLIGPRIISSNILYKDGFGWYGGLGKALLFAVTAFALLMYRSGVTVRLPVWRRRNVAWLGLAMLTFGVAWLSVDRLIAGERTVVWLTLSHVLLWASVLFALGGCVGPASLRLLARAYRRPLLIAIASGAGFYVLLVGIYHTWPLLAGVVLHAVAWLLRLGGLSVAVIPPRTLLLTKFGITVAQSCSGIESLALFSGLYAVAAFVDWRRFNKRRLVLLFPIALVLLFVCNILRVYGLVMAGYYINPQLAFSLFHTYAGMIFFVLYSLAFWALAYKWLTEKSGIKRPAGTHPSK